MIPGGFGDPPRAAGMLPKPLLGAGFWVKGREGGGGTPWGWVSPCPQQRCPSPQVPPLAGGDADRELQRAASLLLPAAHLPAAAAG